MRATVAARPRRAARVGAADPALRRPLRRGEVARRAGARPGRELPGAGRRRRLRHLPVVRSDCPRSPRRRPHAGARRRRHDQDRSGSRGADAHRLPAVRGAAPGRRHPRCRCAERGRPERAPQVARRAAAGDDVRADVGRARRIVAHGAFADDAAGLWPAHHRRSGAAAWPRSPAHARSRPGGPPCSPMGASARRWRSGRPISRHRGPRPPGCSRRCLARRRRAAGGGQGRDRQAGAQPPGTGRRASRRLVA